MFQTSHISPNRRLRRMVLASLLCAGGRMARSHQIRCLSRSPRWQRHCLIFGCRAASVASVAKQGFDVAHGVIMAWQRIAAGMVKHCHHRAPFFLLRVVVKGLSMKERTGRTFLGFCSPCSMLNEGLMLMLAPNWMWYGAKETSLSDSFFG